MVGVFIIATILTASVAIGLQFYFSRTLALDSAVCTYRHTADLTSSYLNDIDDNAVQILSILSGQPELIVEGRAAAGTFPLIAGMMANHPLFYGIYIGFGNGDFFEVINLDSSPGARLSLKAVAGDRWIIMDVRDEGDQRLRHIAYYDDAFRQTRSRTEKTDFDPRIRPWFVHARTDRVYKTDPYLFHYLQEPGRSYSIKMPSHDAVLTIDITLSSLSGFLKRQTRDPNAEIYLYQDNGTLIASNQWEDREDLLPPSGALPLSEDMRAYVHRLGKIRVSNELDWPPIDFAVSGSPRGYTVDLLRMIGSMAGLEVEFVNGYAWNDLLGFFKNKQIDVLQPVVITPDNAALGILSDPVLSLSYAAVTRAGEPVIRDIGQMRDKPIAIPAGWSIIPVIREAFPDIRILETDSSEDAIRAVVEHTAYATVDASVILHHTAASYFARGIMFHENIRLGDKPLPGELHFLIQSDMPMLAELLNAALAQLGEAAIRDLRQRWFHGQESSAVHKKHTVPYEVLVDAGEHAENLGTLSRKNIGGRPMLIYITRLQQDNGAGDYFAVVTPEKHLLAPSMQRVRISIAVTAGCLLLLLPLTWLFAAPIVRPIKRLALENDKIKQRRYDKVELHDTAIKEIFELSTSIVDMALTIKQHEESLKTLLESFIQLIAQAIDDKSPFTAEHCARVPKLALMLVDAASRSSRKPFDEFRLHGGDEYREFRIAAWLHDCGKITTPEYIVNKATKLETLYNRIHEIRMRFEVLWRDAEIDYLKKAADRPGSAAEADEALEEKRRRLQDDFAFIAGLNIGGESMTDDEHRRLQELATMTWQRHFDDRLGLSPMEADRCPAEKKPLPVTENLIADKPEHLIAHSHDMTYDQKYGITMDIPDHLYDRGELHNLSVNRGTLTREDRFKIQEHMISTIKMLESLPFPEELARVPRYASTHHETLRGTGYPRKLSGDELSIPERIIAVADIFEALTAADRPYKNAKKLSEAVDILYAMVEAGDIDRDVFELFLTSGVYLTYSKRYLNPEQIDDVIIGRYVRP
ncbi:hypothetical protein JCM14469_09530 [Desulfatiferula olefinivorans]